jgi:thiamine-monophosphate kinase
LSQQSKRPPRRRPDDERSLVEWLAARPETAGLIGDDAAVFRARGAHVVTVDSQVAGVHLLPDPDPDLLARRLLAVNLSDLAAMGARPAHAFLALAAAPGFEHRRFFAGFLREARRHGVVLAGGDLSSAPVTCASLTLIGRRWPRSRRFLRRADARPGDLVYLGGTVGESALGLELVRRGAGVESNAVALPPALRIPATLRSAARRAVLRHLLPRPQLELGAWLARRARAAAIDVSDGVARDLHRLCAASGVGASIDAELLPRSAGFARLAAELSLDPLASMLGGGEDYVLLFTLPAGVDVDASFGCHRVGRIEAGSELFLAGDGGERRALPDLGWDHLSRYR